MPSGKRAIHIVADAKELSRVAAGVFVRRAEAAVQEGDSCSVALSGGSTPRALYSLLASDSEPFRVRFPWDKTHFFWGDERHVPPDHPHSNYRMAHEALLSKVPLSPTHVHRFKSESVDAAAAAQEYEHRLRQFFRLEAGQLPRFDVVLLGMGSDGHTASLFPGSAAVHERTRLVVANWVEKLKAYRFTLTPPVLTNAAFMIFLVSGEGKAEALRAILEGAEQPDRFPAQLMQPTHGELLWLVDRAAARLLKPAVQ